MTELKVHFKDDVNIKGTSNGNNALYGIYLNNYTDNMGSVSFEKDLKLQLYHNSINRAVILVTASMCSANIIRLQSKAKLPLILVQQDK